MFLLIYPVRVIVFLCIFYGVCVFGVYALLDFFCLQRDSSPLTMAFSGGAVLNLGLLGFCYWGWRKVWSCIPALNSLLFPDLNGVWEMKIHYRNAEVSGSVSATAVIKQNWLSMSMEVLSENSESQTLAIVPKKDQESGRAQIFYFYRVTPKKTDVEAKEPYEGSANLKFSALGINKLTGNYYTSAATDGHFELSRQD
ncbi:hypothetical protein ACIQYQ_19380 [Pseudomonas asiatica]|uniref:Cap15 family cyclic dinucleotide receptor domain-containing protein n=1 Tax=Pseudomonas asiatica TaxID=2219225 RepID=UPI00383BCB3C